MVEVNTIDQSELVKQGSKAQTRLNKNKTREIRTKALVVIQKHI